MIWADWAIVLILGLSCLVGLIRGLIKEAFSVVIWVAAALTAKIFGSPVSVLLTSVIETPSLRLVTAYAILFVGVLLLGAMLSYLVSSLVRATGLSGTDRLLGVLFGAARGFIIVMILVIWLPEILPVQEDGWWQQSTLLPFFVECEQWTVDLYHGVSEWFLTLWGSAEALPDALPSSDDLLFVE
ncbi:MAG: CvpA family protein [Cellvibrio sp.]